MLGKGEDADEVTALFATLGPWEVKTYPAVGKVAAVCMYEQVRIHLWMRGKDEVEEAE